MKLFALTLRTMIARKTWVIALFVVGIVPFLLPVLVPFEFSDGLIEPARAQAAWGLLWVVTLLWLLGQGSKQGHQNVRSSLGLYFQSQGQGRYRQSFETWLAMMALLIPLVLVVCLVSCFAAAPSQASEKSVWYLANLQYGSLFLIVASSLLYLSIALGSRFGALTGYLTSVGLALYGLYGVGFFDLALRDGGAPMLQFIYAISPHFHLADLTDRLVFKMGSLDGKSYANILMYLVGVACVLAAGSTFAARTTAKS